MIQITFTIEEKKGRASGGADIDTRSATDLEKAMFAAVAESFGKANNLVHRLAVQYLKEIEKEDP